MLSDNLEKVKARIQAACKRVGRNPDEITLVCVTKGVGVEKIREIIGLGILDIGENRIQEARLKYDLLAGIERRVRWHLVGHLQKNKAKYAVRIFDLIHSVDSWELACVINREAAKIGKPQAILIEVNISGETTKFGLKPQDTLPLTREILNLGNLKLSGLMTIAPIVDNPEKARPYFRMLRELRDKINQQLTTSPSTWLGASHPPLDLARGKLSALSMGMSQDFEVAIEEGANLVRIGRAIFNPRNQ